MIAARRQQSQRIRWVRTSQESVKRWIKQIIYCLIRKRFGLGNKRKNYFLLFLMIVVLCLNPSFAESSHGHDQLIGIQLFIRSFVPSFLHSFISAFMHPSTPFFLPSLIHAFIHSFNQSIIQLA